MSKKFFSMIDFYKNKESLIVKKSKITRHDETMLRHYRAQLSTLTKDKESDKLPIVPSRPYKLKRESNKANNFGTRRLDQEQIYEIMSRLESGETQHEVALQFGVSQSLISVTRANFEY